MAWSDAARRASAEVRRRLAEAKGRFHTAGTPRKDPYYLSIKARREAAMGLRRIRKNARMGRSPDWMTDEATIRSAANISQHGHYYALSRERAPKRTPLQQYKAGSQKRLRAAARSSPGRITSGRKRSRGRYA